MSIRPIRRALISVYDKSALLDLARALHDAGVEMVSTGSTAAVIGNSGMPVTTVEDMTGFPESLGGRVKTLHPSIHAGLLANPADPQHVEELRDLGVEPFDLVVCNLYPFRETVASGAPPTQCVEQIDIGGPAMIRAAAKNHAAVAVVVTPARYPDVHAALAAGGFTADERRALAAEAFAHTAEYDVAVAMWFAEQTSGDRWPPFMGRTYSRAGTLRYGENPHQPAALYLEHGAVDGLAQAEQLHGEPLSYNNYVDADAALRAAYDFKEPAVAIVKHANPCGIALGGDVAEAHRKAHASDPLSAYGGVIAANRPVTEDMARQVSEVLTHVVCAPDFEPAALDLLRARKSVRLLRCAEPPSGTRMEWRPVSGGALVQVADRLDEEGDNPENWTLASGPPAGDEVIRDLEFAWRAVRAVKSNGVLIARDQATVGVGMGQVNRVDAARLAVARAGARAEGSVAASDAFFPFPDGLQVLIDAGLSAVVQPGGSVRDGEVIAVAQDAGITMYLTGTRHFTH